MEPIDTAEAMLPMEANDPTLAIDSTESCDPIDSTELVDHSDHFERGIPAVLLTLRSTSSVVHVCPPASRPMSHPSRRCTST